MVLLVFRDAVSVFLGDQDAYTVAVVTVRLWITTHPCKPRCVACGCLSNLPSTNHAPGKNKQLLMLRTAAIVIPVYIILVAVTELLHRRRHRQVCLDLFTKGHAARWPYMQFEAEA